MSTATKFTLPQSPSIWKGMWKGECPQSNLENFGQIFFEPLVKKFVIQVYFTGDVPDM